MVPFIYLLQRRRCKQLCWLAVCLPRGWLWVAQSYEMYSYLSQYTSRRSATAPNQYNCTSLFWQRAFVCADTGFHESSHTKIYTYIHMYNNRRVHMCRCCCNSRRWNSFSAAPQFMMSLLRCFSKIRVEVGSRCGGKSKFAHVCFTACIWLSVGVRLGVGVCLKNMTGEKRRLFTYYSHSTVAF